MKSWRYPNYIKEEKSELFLIPFHHVSNPKYWEYKRLGLEIARRDTLYSELYHKHQFNDKFINLY